MGSSRSLGVRFVVLGWELGWGVGGYSAAAGEVVEDEVAGVVVDGAAVELECEFLRPELYLRRSCYILRSQGCHRR